MRPRGRQGGDATSPSPKPTVPPPKVWEASASKPVRVWVGGDSMGGELGWGLGPMLDKIKGFKPILFYKESSGICRPDFFDWRRQVESVMRTDKPDAVVVMIGTNDIQSVWQDGKWIAHGDPDWKQIYEKRVRDMTRPPSRRRRPPRVLGRHADHGEEPAQLVHEVRQQDRPASGGRHPGGEYIDSWELFANEDGTFVPSLRLADGVHFTVEGQKLMGKAVSRRSRRTGCPTAYRRRERRDQPVAGGIADLTRRRGRGRLPARSARARMVGAARHDA